MSEICEFCGKEPKYDYDHEIRGVIVCEDCLLVLAKIIPTVSAERRK
jgi:transcription initiation factor TFIIIB Brf1 subunit/transcription initiation factor TFIIB